MSEIVIVGGGVIGLSLAYELSGRGRSVTLLERGELGREASWAGAGILTPASLTGARSPKDRLRAHSLALIEEWSARLAEETGIDNGYRRSGAFEVALEDGDRPALEAAARRWRAEGIEVHEVLPCEMPREEPALTRRLAAAYHLPAEAQVRNPWHLRALAEGCRRRGVTLETGTEVVGFARRGGRVSAAETPQGEVAGECFAVAAGAWSPGLLGSLGLDVSGEPVRGQMVLLNPEKPPCRRIVWAGSRYLVPRPEGRLLVGSTLENAGFDSRPTVEGVLDLLRFALRLLPGLEGAPVEGTWAGLRPGSDDDLPSLGRVPGTENLYLASGHHRAGLELSAGSALVLAQLMLGEEPSVPLEAFRPSRTVSQAAGAAYEAAPAGTADASK